MLCWSPLAGGMLTGKYTDQSGPPPDSRVGVRANIDLPRYWNAQSFAVIDELKAIAAQLDTTPSQVALSWLLQDRRVTAAIARLRASRSAQETPNIPAAPTASAPTRNALRFVPITRSPPCAWQPARLPP